MPKKPGLAPAEGNKTRKVHPQVGKTGGCGCPKSRETIRRKETNQEKCIRKLQDQADADAQNPEKRSGRRKQIKKSASASCKTRWMRMPKIQRNDSAEGNKSRKVHPQVARPGRCGCPKSRETIRRKETNQEKCIRKL